MTSLSGSGCMLDEGSFIASGVASSNCCSYAISLEALSRGLNVKWYSAVGFSSYGVSLSKGSQLGNLYSIDDGRHCYVFNKTRLIHAGQEVRLPFKNKSTMKNFFVEHALPTPGYAVFSFPYDDSELAAKADNIGYPLVVKPINGSMGRGVVTNINHLGELSVALSAIGSESLLIEKQVFGSEYRVYTIGGKLISACRREPASVIGDGVSTVEEIIRRKNQYKRRLKFPSIKMDSELSRWLERDGYGMHSVLKKGQVLVLSSKLGRSSGGDVVEGTDSFPDHAKRLVDRLCDALAQYQLPILGIDMVVDKCHAYIIEVNFRPQVSSVLFPDMGQGKDFPKALLDFLYPSSKREFSVRLDYRSAISRLKNISDLPFLEVSDCANINHFQTSFEEKFGGSVFRRLKKILY